MRDLLAMLAVVVAGGAAMAATLEWGSPAWVLPAYLAAILVTAGGLSLVTRDGR